MGSGMAGDDILMDDLGQDMPTSEFGDDFPEDSFMEDLSDNELGEDMPENELGEDMPENELGEDFPDSDFNDEQPYELKDGHFFVVDQRFLGDDKARDFDLYVKQGDQFLLFRSRDMPFTEIDRQQHAASNRKLLILKTEREKYLYMVESSMMSTFMDTSIPLNERSEVLYSMCTVVISDMLADPESKRHLGRSKKLVKEISNFVGHAPEALQSLFSQKNMDAYVVTHCINVCIFGIGLGKRMGITSPSDMQALGLGCLLHDIGKQAIPARIVNKPGRLSDQEWMIMRRHPELGLRICKKSGGIPELAMIPVIQHHEKIDGSGYPQKLKGSEMHLFGKITSIADIFDALTSDRPYSEAENAFPALKIMKDEFVGKVDPEIFREMILMLKG